jgi:hypothetical protein
MPASETRDGAGASRMLENCAVPEGTRIYFPLYPALRLRLRAGLNCTAPTALDFPLHIPLATTKLRSHAPSQDPHYPSGTSAFFRSL